MRRLDRLYSSLRDRYPLSNLEQCLVLPEPHTKDTLLIIAAQKQLGPIVDWLLEQGVEDGGMSKVRLQLQILLLLALRA